MSSSINMNGIMGGESGDGISDPTTPIVAELKILRLVNCSNSLPNGENRDGLSRTRGELLHTINSSGRLPSFCWRRLRNSASEAASPLIGEQSRP